MSEVSVNVGYDQQFDYNDMNQKLKGRCIIFNNKVFESSGLKSRKEGNEDAAALKFLFKNMGLRVRQKNDFTSSDINSTLRQEPNKVKDYDDLIIICVLTYGERDGSKDMLWAKDVKYSNDEIFRRFTEQNCPKLKGKPKIFIIQAYSEECAKIVAEGTDANCTKNVAENMDVNPSNRDVIPLTPLYSDFCILYSTDGGLVKQISNQTETHRSLFVKILVQELSDKSKNGIQLLDRFTYINRILQERVNTVKVPFIISSLKKRLFFGPIDHQELNTGEPMVFNLHQKYGALSDDSQSEPESVGQCIIFNHEQYKKSMNLTERKGTESDVVGLEEVFSSMGFEVKRHDNLNDHCNRKCIVICILTHGGNREFYAYDGVYDINKLFQYFTHDRCPTLKDKPKIFFIQACRGNSPNKDESRGGGKGDLLSEIPNNADFLVAFCTVPGFVGIRNREKGSWFIQTLTRQLYSGCDDRTHILEVLTRTNDAVSQEYVSNDKIDTLQMPCFVSSLCDLVYFRRTNIT